MTITVRKSPAMHWNYRSDQQRRIGVFFSLKDAIKAMKPLVAEKADGASIAQQKRSKAWKDGFVTFVSDDVVYRFQAVREPICQALATIEQQEKK